MTLSETAKLITLMQLNYPDNFRNMREDTLEGMVRMWQKMFAEEPAALVTAAVEAHIRASTDRFMPNVGQIKEEIRKLTQPEEMSEGEAWERIFRAVKNGTYGSKEEYAKLPKVLQRVVGSPDQLREWAMMDAETVQSVVASNVQRSYRAISKQEAAWAKLPAGFRERIGKITGQIVKPLTLEEGDNG